jgi:signal peptidase
MTRVERLRVGRASTRRRNRFFLGVFGLFATTMIAGLAAWAMIPMLLGWFPYAVTSDSMGPVIERGDVIVAQPHDGANLAEGTILVFDTREGRTAHRIDKVISPVEYVTKGDANASADSSHVQAEQVVGVARIAVPLVGRLILFAREDPPLQGLPLAIALVVIAWLSRFALMSRYDPWLRPSAAELAPSSDEVVTVDVDRIMQKRQAERELFRRDPSMAAPSYASPPVGSASVAESMARPAIDPEGRSDRPRTRR